MADRMRLSPARALALLLCIGVAAFFLWAAWTDAPVPKLVWFGFAAAQLFNAAILWRDGRRRD